jgi:predicted TIM-barrel fold metal-dependent hydrolase
MFLNRSDSRSYKLRQRLNHPVVDSDGHIQEYHPMLLDYLKEEGGSDFVERYKKTRFGADTWIKLSDEDRRDRRVHRPPFWTMPAKNTLDLATAIVPRLFRERMDEMGLDYAVIYGTQFSMMKHPDEEIRRVGCRAVNRLHADLFLQYKDRMTIAAVIPTWTPQEACEELDFAIGELGLKAVHLQNLNFRPVPVIERAAPDVAQYAEWTDNLALDSAYDYDPLWRKCVELKVAPTGHCSGQGWGPRRSISNYTYNHIGNFAMANEAFCKALFLGGVTRRFPGLRFGLLEGGVSWAAQLYNDLWEHWEKRNIRELHANLNPATVDRSFLAELVAEYGGETFASYVEAFRTPPEKTSVGARPGFHPEPEAYLDDFARCEIEDEDDLYNLFVPNFFFGCESDDRMIATAFDTRMNHKKARLGAMFSSDVSHWDVPDMRETLAESYELVEEGLLDEEDFRDFSFANMVHLQGDMNPDFFKGTVIEDAAAKELAKGRRR